MSEKKRITPRRVTLDPYESALTIEYAQETIDSSKNRIKRDIKQTKVRLCNTTVSNDDNDGTTTALAGKIVHQCPYLRPPDEWTTRVHAALMELRSRQRRARGDESPPPSSSSSSSTISSSSSSSSSHHHTRHHHHPPSSLRDVDHYLELLYSTPSDKITSTNHVVSLCRSSVANLPHLVKNHPLLSALSRTVTDDAKESTALCLNILKIFVTFSNFDEWHELLTGRYRVGSLTLSVLDLEVRRSRFLHRAAAAAVTTTTTTTTTKRDDNKKKNDVSEKRRDLVIFFSVRTLSNLACDASVEKKMIKKRLIVLLCVCLYRRSKRCLVVVLSFLRRLTLYERNVREIVELDESPPSSSSSSSSGTAGVLVTDRLVELLKSSDTEVVGQVLRVLFNLSFDGKCRERLIKSDCQSRLAVLLARKKSLRSKTLRVMYHLSLAKKGRAGLAKDDVVDAVMKLLIHFPKEKCVGKELAALAVNMSTNPECAERMLHQNAVRHFLPRIKNHNDVLLAKLLRNLSRYTHLHQIKTLSQLPSSRQQQQQQQRQENDPSSKTNTATHSTSNKSTTYRSKKYWCDHVAPLLELSLTTDDNHDLLVELLGTLGHVTLLDLPPYTTWAKLAAEHSITTFLLKLLLPGMAEGDVVSQILELVRQMLSTSSLSSSSSSLDRTIDEDNDDSSSSSSAAAAAAAAAAAEVLLRDGGKRFFQALDGVWDDRQGVIAAAEVRWRCLGVFKRFCRFRETREVLLYETAAADRIVTCVDDRDPYVRAVAEECLDFIVEYDRKDDGSSGTIADRIRESRFISHNERWLRDAEEEEGERCGDDGGGGGESSFDGVENGSFDECDDDDDGISSCGSDDEVEDYAVLRR